MGFQSKALRDKVAGLGPGELHELVSRLLQCEAARLKLSADSVGVSLDVNVPDEGVDGVVSAIPENSYSPLPPGSSALQCKTTRSADTLAKDAKKEIPKSGVQSALEDGQNYILVWSRDAVESDRRKVLNSFKGSAHETEKIVR